jgi:hypothetical protein
MKIGPLTAEEWAKDTLTMIELGENPLATLIALVERIHLETASVTSPSSLGKVQAAVDQARAERNERRKAR